MEGLGGFIFWYLIFLGSLIIHEAAHALTALWGGDDTAYRGGQVTLDPWPHIRREPFGTVLIPIVTWWSSGYMMGWASAPYNPLWARRYPRRQAAMAAAGPLSNLLLALLALGVLKALILAGVFAAPHSAAFERVVAPSPGLEESFWAPPLARCLSILLNLNLLLFLFNLIPLPPLDGSGILSGLLPRKLGPLFEKLAAEPMMSMLCLLVVWKFFSYQPAFGLVLRALHPGVDWS